jgi:histidine triad (HIT) family protein
MEDCVFCKIVKGELPSTKVYEDDGVIAFNDTNPSMPIHILIVPKKHIENLSKARNEDLEILGKLQLVASKIAQDKGFYDYKLVTNNGTKAGQVVFHLHYHLLGGFK